MSQVMNDPVTLANGTKMPRLGLGTWRSSEGGELERAVRWALGLGYRHIDTAMIYGNEEGVGQAIRDSGIPREEIFVTTKLWNDDLRKGADACRAAFDASLRRLRMDYVDLYLVHWPVRGGKWQDAWRVLEEIYDGGRGRARAIGVSNFLVHHLEELRTFESVTPMVNQVEFHPRLVQQELLDYCAMRRIQHEAWSPLMQGKELFENATLRRIAGRHGRSVAQVVLRWDVQKGTVTIPKSVTRERIAENGAIFDFALSEEEVREIDALDEDRRVGSHPDTFTF